MSEKPCAGSAGDELTAAAVDVKTKRRESSSMEQRAKEYLGH
jgi:hypothetical protein